MGKILIIKGADFSNVSLGKVAQGIVITVTADPVEGGGVSGTGFYEEGEQIEITATPNTGYAFLQWNDGNIESTRKIIVGNAPQTYVALFRELQQIDLSEYTLINSAVSISLEDNTSLQITQKITTFDGYIIPVSVGDKYQITTSLQRNQPAVTGLSSNVLNIDNVVSLLVPHKTVTPALYNEEFIIPTGVSHIFIQQVNSTYDYGEYRYPVPGYEIKLYRIGSIQ